MLARGVSRCCLTLKLRPLSIRPINQYGQQCRQYSMPSGPVSSASSTSSSGMLAPITNELDKIAPSFNISGSQIQIIKTPNDFYETLKVGGMFVKVKVNGICSVNVTRLGYGRLRNKYSYLLSILENPKKSWYELCLGLIHIDADYR